MQNPSTDHQRLVGTLINHFKNNLGLTILSAETKDYLVKPGAHGRHAPDIVAADSSGTINIGEAKVGEDIISSESEEQYLDFSNRIMPVSNLPVPFHIIVYKQDENLLIEKLIRLGLGLLIGKRIKIWTI